MQQTLILNTEICGKLVLIIYTANVFIQHWFADVSECPALTLQKSVSVSQHFNLYIIF